MAWRDRLADPSITTYYWIKVSGIPQRLTTFALPAAWYTGGTSEIVALDLDRGFRPPAQILDRKTGGVSPSSLTLRIGPDDLSGTLRRLFATRLSSGWTAVLTSTLGWTEGAAGAGTIAINDATGAPGAPFDLYCGPETIGVTAVVAGPPASLTIDTSRGKYGSLAWKYAVDPDLPQGQRVLRTYPGQWEGRIVSLWEGFANAAGQPLDAGFEGPDQHEIWSGRIVALNPASPWGWWEMQTQSLDSLLDMEVGGGLAKGRLAWSSAKGAEAVPWPQVGTQGYVVDGSNTGRIICTPPVGVATPVDFSLTPGWYGDLLSDISKAAVAALNAASIAGGWGVTFNPAFAAGWQAIGDPWGDDYPDDYRRLRLWVECDDPATDLALEVTSGSVCRQAGFTVGTHGFDFQAAAGLFYVWQNVPPPMVFLSPSAHEIRIQEELDSGALPWPANGFVRLHDPTSDQYEIAYHTGLTEQTTGANRIIVLTGVQRGGLHTKPIEIWIPPSASDESNTGAAAGAAVQIQQVVAFENDTVPEIALRLALGTGGNVPRHATYDTSPMPEGVGAGLSAAYFDIDRFSWVGTSEIPAMLARRDLVWSKPFKLREWLMKELLVLGYVLISRETPQGYKITLDRIRQPLAVGGQTLTPAEINTAEMPHIESSLHGLITIVRCKLRWDVVAEKFTEETVTVWAADAVLDTGVRRALEIEARGLRWWLATYAGSQWAALQIAASVFAHFARRYEIVTLTANRPAWRYETGHMVRVTLPGAPTWYGDAGWTDEAMVVLASEKAHGVSGRGPACRLTLLHLPDRKLSYYVPCGRVAAHNDPAVEITLDPNVYTGAAEQNPVTLEYPAVDVQWFAPGDRVKLVRPGDEATYTTNHVVLTKVGNVLGLSGALPAWLADGDVVTYAAYDTCLVSQRGYVFIADNNALLGAANDAPFQWS